MPIMLTERACALAGTPRFHPKTLWDRGAVGLGLKITPRGTKIWLLQLTYPGHHTQSSRTLGYFPAMGVEAARAKAKRWYAEVKQGIDPGAAEEAERRKAEAARRAEALKQSHTFAAFAKKYAEERKGRRAKTDAKDIARWLMPEWGGRPLHEITPRDVRLLIDKLKRQSPYTARTAWTHLVGIFKAAVHEELIEASPAASLDRKQLFKGAKIEHRQRVLSDDEVFAFWRAAGRLGYPAGPFYQLLLLTGVRLSELSKARWSELHPELRRLIRSTRERIAWAAVPAEIKIWTVPRERFKSDAAHIVQLSDAALEILVGLKRFDKCDFLFTFNGETATHFGDKIKKRLDARMLRTLKALARMRGDDPDTVKLPPWVLHDLRRVVRSNLSALNIEDHVAEAVLGHARKGLQRIYDQHRYAPQIRAALERWAEKLRGIVAPQPSPPPAKVVPLRGRGRP